VRPTQKEGQMSKKKEVRLILRNFFVVQMITEKKGEVHKDQKKEKDKNACRGKHKNDSY